MTPASERLPREQAEQDEVQGYLDPLNPLEPMLAVAAAAVWNLAQSRGSVVAGVRAGLSTRGR